MRNKAFWIEFIIMLGLLLVVVAVTLSGLMQANKMSQGADEITEASLRSQNLVEYAKANSQQLEDVLGQIDDIVIRQATDRIQINYAVPILDTQILSVKLEVPFPYEKGSEVCVGGWYVQSTEEWEYEEEGFGEIIVP